MPSSPQTHHIDSFFNVSISAKFFRKLVRLTQPNANWKKVGIGQPNKYTERMHRPPVNRFYCKGSKNN